MSGPGVVPPSSGPQKGSDSGLRPDTIRDPRAASVIEAVRNHQGSGEREELSRSIILGELERLDRPFDENADLTHITASAIVVGRRGVILHRHRRLHRWLQPGGHVEVGESPPEAALRECQEETGLTATHPPAGPTLVHLDVHTSARGHVHLDFRYLLWAPDLPPAPGPAESQEVVWFSWEEALEVADDALAGGLVSARRLIRASATGEPEGQLHQREDP